MIVRKRRKNRFHFIPFRVNIIVKQLFQRQDWKMGKVEEELLACLYDKAIPVFYSKNENKNAWEAVGKDLGFEADEATKMLSQVFEQCM